MRTIQLAFALALALSVGCAFNSEGTASVGEGGAVEEDAGGTGGRDAAAERAPTDVAPGDVARPADGALDAAADSSPDVGPRDVPPPPPDVPLLPRVLLAVGDEPMNAVDGMVADRLMALGLRVRAMPGRNRDEGMAIRDAAMADGKLIVLSSSLPQGTGVVVLLQPLAIPMVCLKPELLDTLGIGSQSDTTPLNTEIAIISPTHPLAGGRMGTIVVAAQPTIFGWGRPLDSAVAVATESGNRDHVIIFGVDRGTNTMMGNAPARRASFLALETTFRNFNAVGWALFDTAVRWAMGNI